MKEEVTYERDYIIESYHTASTSFPRVEVIADDLEHVAAAVTEALTQYPLRQIYIQGRDHIKHRRSK